MTQMPNADRLAAHSSGLYDPPSEAGAAAGPCQMHAELDVTGRRVLAVVLELSGDLDRMHASRLRNAFSSAVAKRSERITVDLAEVTFLDSTVLRTLIATRLRCVAMGTQLVLRGPRPGIERLLACTRLNRFFEVEGGSYARA